MTIHYQSLAIWLLLAFTAQQSMADASALAGTVEAKLNGTTHHFPLLSTKIEGSIEGDLATVKIFQTFTNPLDEIVHARYLFPIQKNAAVYQMVMRVGDEEIRAEIQEKKTAQKTFTAAKKAGKSAALLQQHRPNMFTQKIANLAPGLPIEVEISYTHSINKVDGLYEMVIPLVVGPRFIPPSTNSMTTNATTNVSADELEKSVVPSPIGDWQIDPVPSYPPVRGIHIPKTIAAERVSIELELNAGSAIYELSSDTHDIISSRLGPQSRRIQLQQDKVIDNKDFVLHYSLAGADNSAGVLSHYEQGLGTFSLLIEPPKLPTPEQILPREMVFVLDCSGSMSGLPMQASKSFMRKALQGLRATDTFRIIRFSDAATEFSAQPLIANRSNVARGLQYTNTLNGSGGTMMTEGIKQALKVLVPDGSVRIVVFLTDGYIGNEVDVLRIIESKKRDARLYAFGVGTGTNRYLLDEMARVGQGFARYLDPTADVEEVTDALAARLDAPVLTNISLDLPNAEITDLTPTKIPDLFAGDSVRVQGRYKRPGTYQITVKARTNGRNASIPVIAKFTDEPIAETIEKNWARAQIADLMHSKITPVNLRPNNLKDADIKQQVTALGLQHQLVSQWTSFVAVSRKIVNTNPNHTSELDVPLNRVAGVANSAYAPGPMLVGSAAPEASLSSIIALLAAIGLFRTYQVRRRSKLGAKLNRHI